MLLSYITMMHLSRWRNEYLSWGHYLDFNSFPPTSLLCSRIQSRVPHCTQLSCLPCLLWWVTVPQTVLFFMTLTALKHQTSFLVFMRLTDWKVRFEDCASHCGVFLPFNWAYEFGGRIPHRWNACPYYMSSYYIRVYMISAYNHWWYWSWSFA